MSKHTPGPWQVHGSHVYGPDHERELITQCHGNGGRMIANRNLIAAGPKLLEALKTVLPFLENKRDTREYSCLPEPTKDEEGYLQAANDAVDVVRAAIAEAERPR